MGMYDIEENQPQTPEEGPKGFIHPVETPGKELVGMREPPDKDINVGVFIVMLTNMAGPLVDLRANRHYLMDKPQAKLMIEQGYARLETKLEKDIADLQGLKRTPYKMKKKPKVKSSDKEG